MYIKGKVYLFNPCVVGLASMMSDRLDQKYQLWVVFDSTRTHAHKSKAQLPLFSVSVIDSLARARYLIHTQTLLITFTGTAGMRETLIH